MAILAAIGMNFLESYFNLLLDIYSTIVVYRLHIAEYQRLIFFNFRFRIYCKVIFFFFFTLLVEGQSKTENLPQDFERYRSHADFAS